MIKSKSLLLNIMTPTPLYRVHPAISLGENPMRDVFMTIGILAVTCLSMLVISMRAATQAKPDLQAYTTTPTIVADAPPPDDQGTPGRRG
jgi:hypothetical protein